MEASKAQETALTVGSGEEPEEGRLQDLELLLTGPLVFPPAGSSCPCSS